MRQRVTATATATRSDKLQPAVRQRRHPQNSFVSVCRV